MQAEDTLAAAIELKNGGLATLELTTAARPKDIEASITITGTSGVVQIGGIALNKIEQWKFLDAPDEEEKIIKEFSEEVDRLESSREQLKNIYQTYKVKKVIMFRSCKPVPPYKTNSLNLR